MDDVEKTRSKFEERVRQEPSQDGFSTQYNGEGRILQCSRRECETCPDQL